MLPVTDHGEGSRVLLRVPIPVQLPAVLRECAGHHAEIAVDAADVAGALGSLTTQYPRLRRHLFTEQGSLRPHVNVYVNQDEVRDLPNGLATQLGRGDVLMILPSVAGG